MAAHLQGLRNQEDSASVCKSRAAAVATGIVTAANLARRTTNRRGRDTARQREISHGIAATCKTPSWNSRRTQNIALLAAFGEQSDSPVAQALLRRCAVLLAIGGGSFKRSPDGTHKREWLVSSYLTSHSEPINLVSLTLTGAVTWQIVGLLRLQVNRNHRPANAKHSLRLNNR